MQTATSSSMPTPPRGIFAVAQQTARADAFYAVHTGTARCRDMGDVEALCREQILLDAAEKGVSPDVLREKLLHKRADPTLVLAVWVLRAHMQYVRRHGCSPARNAIFDALHDAGMRHIRRIIAVTPALRGLDQHTRNDVAFSFLTRLAQSHDFTRTPTPDVCGVLSASINASGGEMDRKARIDSYVNAALESRAPATARSELKGIVSIDQPVHAGDERTWGDAADRALWLDSVMQPDQDEEDDAAEKLASVLPLIDPAIRADEAIEFARWLGDDSPSTLPFLFALCALAIDGGNAVAQKTVAALMGSGKPRAEVHFKRLYPALRTVSLEGNDDLHIAAQLQASGAGTLATKIVRMFQTVTGPARPADALWAARVLLRAENWLPTLCASLVFRAAILLLSATYLAAHRGDDA
jgi:hypothetical protein